MPRVRKFTALARPKPINIILTGLGRGVGRDKDRFRTTSGTRDHDVYEARIAMVRDLSQRMMFDLLRALLDKRFDIAELHNAYRSGTVQLKALLVDHSGKLVAPLLRTYIRQSKQRDKLRTEARIERFLEAVGARGEALGRGTDTSAAEKRRKAWRERVSTSEFTASNVTDFLGELQSARHTHSEVEATGATRNRYRAAIGGFATWMVRHSHMEVHPVAFKAVQKFAEGGHRLPDLSPAEYRDYFARLDEVRPDLAIVFKLLVHTGPDISEVERLQVRDLELAGESPRVRYKRTKTNTPERRVPLPRVLALEIQGHIAAHKLKGTDAVFRMFARRNYNLAHRLAREAIGRDDLRIKDLRHVAAIEWVRAGVHIDRVRKWLGHATLSQTQVYTDYANDTDGDTEAAARAVASITGEADVSPISRRRA